MRAVLAAVFTDADEAADGQLRDGLASLVQRPFKRKPATGTETVALSSGEAEMLALRQSPHDSQKARSLAGILLARADADTGFEDALKEWLKEAEPLSASTGNVANIIHDGRYGVVIQGRDFPNLIVNTYPAPVASRGSAGT